MASESTKCQEISLHLVTQVYIKLSCFNVPSFLYESFSVLLQLFLFKANNDTEQLVLQSLHGHSVIDDHCSTEYSRSVLGIGKFCVQVKPGKIMIRARKYALSMR